MVRVAGSLATWVFVFLAASAWAETAGPPSDTTDTVPGITDSAVPPAAPAPIELAPVELVPVETVAPEEEFLPQDVEERSLEHRWSEAVDSVSAKIASEERPREDADALFVELVNDLRRELRALRTDIREDRGATTRVIGEYERVRQLYDTRIRLLGLTTDKFRKLVTGAGLEGVLELRLESRYLATQLLYQTFRIPQDVSQRVEDARIAPLPAMFATLELLVAIGVFLAWRRWAKRELPGIQARLRSARSGNPTFGRMERFVGLLRRVRRPIEWLLLFTVAFRVLEFGHAADLEAVLWTVIWWFLIAWLAVCAGQAVLARRLGTSDEDLERLRARSLRLLAAWLLVIGMGLSVAEDIVGQGTLYAWIWRMFVVLTIPTVVILITWWRSKIFEALDQEAERSTFAAGLRRNRTGVGGFLAATMGVVYLVAVRTFARALREMENFEGGRRTLSALTQFEMVVAPLIAAQSDEPEVAITEELRERIVNAEVADIDGVGLSVVNPISARMGTKHAAMAIVGERGAGKSRILRQLQAKHEGKIRVLRCPVGGFAAFRTALAETIGVREEELTRKVALTWVEESGIEMFVVDGFHRMVRPSMGGGTELDELLPFLLVVFSKASWCYTVDSAAVRYLFALHGNVISAPVLVPRWTELQIREYIENKCRAVGIKFDVSDFRVPRHLELGRGKEGGDRRRRGFYRLLWHASEGNPASAVEVFVRSLRTGRGRELFVREIREPPVEDLEQQSLKTLLILKFIIQCEYATAEEISRGLGFSRTLVDVALTNATANQWIIKTDDRYRVSMRWFRTLKGYLKRRNLISSFASED